MSRINDKLGLKAAGARARLNSLSGVKCRMCPHSYVVSVVIHSALTWLCAFCGFSWRPTYAEVLSYNAGVRVRDRVTFSR